MASARPAPEEQSATPPGKVVTVSSRSPRCPRSQAALRNSKTFSPSAAPCSSGEARPSRVSSWVCGCQSSGHGGPLARRGPASIRAEIPTPHGEGECRA